MSKGRLQRWLTAILRDLWFDLRFFLTYPLR